MKRCPQCGAEYSNDETYCGKDRALLQPTTRVGMSADGLAETVPPSEMPAAAAPAASTLGGTVLAAGTVIGEYRVTKKIGEGGMGAVYAGVHPVIDKRVAIKVLSPALASDEEAVRRFADEARVVNKIGHPNIIDIFSFGRLPDGRHYFVMEFLDGESLTARLEKGPLGAVEARRFLTQMCGALEAAHRGGVVHRDLKPDNVWIARPAHGDSFVKLLDFGIAKLLFKTDPMSATKTGTPMGTPYYMSPEQCMGKNVDHRTDIYAMGVILYQVFTGELPFTGDSFVEVITQHLAKPAPMPSMHCPVDAPVEELILNCLEKDPAKRPQSAAALGARIDSVLDWMVRAGSADVRLAAAKASSATKVLRGPALEAPPPPAAVATGLVRREADAAPEPAAGRPRARRWVLPAAGAVLLAGIALAVALGGGARKPLVTETGPVPPAVAPAPAAAHGAFKVQVSNAESAVFLLDGVEFARGAREAEIVQVEALRTHRLRIEAPGMKPHERQITVPPGATAQIHVTLESEGGTGDKPPTRTGHSSFHGARSTRPAETASPAQPAAPAARPKSRDSTLGDEIFGK